MLKDDSSDYITFPHLCKPLPMIFAPLNSQMCIRLCNEVFMQPYSVVVDGLFLLTV
uniref:Uncharacterized protein n=1 Tax=Anguilla anguilla TaxID=7936 RepID=A0A0E9XEQ9_ANGAN